MTSLCLVEDVSEDSGTSELTITSDSVRLVRNKSTHKYQLQLKEKEWCLGVVQNFPCDPAAKFCAV